MTKANKTETPKVSPTISFAGRTYGKPDTDYYLHVEVQTAEGVIRPAFSKTNISYKLQKDGSVTVTMARKYAEKRELAYLDGITALPEVKVVAEAEAAAAAA